MPKRYSLVFLLAFLLNLAWENLHSFLYLNYQGGVITELILFRATLFDAIFITLLLFLLRGIVQKRVRLYLLIFISLAVAIGIEFFALTTGRWVYGPMMPIIPFLKVGLSPIVQLPFLGWLADVLTKHLLREQ